MQTTALDFMGRRIKAQDALSGCNYLCEECGTEVRRRMGEHRRAHFFHLSPPTSCQQSGKSMIHIDLQSKLCEELGCLQEVKFPKISRIADLLWEDKRLVIEVQCSPIKGVEVVQRNRDYASAGYRVLWLLFDERFLRSLWSQAERNLVTWPHYYFNRRLEIYDCFSCDLRGKRYWKLKGPCLNLRTLQDVPVRRRERACAFIQRRWDRWPFHIEGDVLSDYFTEGRLYSEIICIEQRTISQEKQKDKRNVWQRYVEPFFKFIYIFLWQQLYG